MRRLFDIIVALIGGALLTFFYDYFKSNFPEKEDYLRSTVGDYYNMELSFVIAVMILVIGVVILLRQTTIIHKIKDLEDFKINDIKAAVEQLNKEKNSDSAEEKK